MYKSILIIAAVLMLLTGCEEKKKPVTRRAPSRPAYTPPISQIPKEQLLQISQKVKKCNADMKLLIKYVPTVTKLIENIQEIQKETERKRKLNQRQSGNLSNDERIKELRGYFNDQANKTHILINVIKSCDEASFEQYIKELKSINSDNFFLGNMMLISISTNEIKCFWKIVSNEAVGITITLKRMKESYPNSPELNALYQEFIKVFEQFLKGQ